MLNSKALLAHSLLIPVFLDFNQAQVNVLFSSPIESVSQKRWRNRLSLTMLTGPVKSLQFCSLFHHTCLVWVIADLQMAAL